MPAKILRSFSIYIILVIVSLAFLYPIIVTVTNSFMGTFEVINRYSINYNAANSFSPVTALHFIEMSLIPEWVTVKQYFNLMFDKPLYLGLFWNSVIITVPVVIGQVLVSSPAAYAFELSRFKFKESLYFIYIVIMLMPLQVTLVPNYIMADFLHINGTYWAIILPAVFSPFGVFLIRQYLKGLPYEYIEAAKIDGANHFGIFMYIVMPIIKSAVAALAILTFVEYWNVVDQAVIFIKESYLEPMSVYLSRMTTEGGIGMIFAASCFYMLPAILIFLFGQEYMVEGIQLSGIK